MKYQGHALGRDVELSIQREGLRLGDRFVDFADVAALRPVNHRVLVDLLDGSSVEISMLGFSFDGFWEDLLRSFGDRSLEALFVDETELMRCEGEYAFPGGQGRGVILLCPDAVCILPQTARALRIPLCFTADLRLEGYQLRLTMSSGIQYVVGRMGYDTVPFAERAAKAADLVKKQRAAALREVPTAAPFTEKGLFRTKRPDQYWNAAFGSGVCAVEFYAGEDAATYCYRFSESQPVFLRMLTEAAEAVGTHREIICLPDQRIAEMPLCRMAAARSEAVRFLRSRAAGRLIHTANHAQRLAEFLRG